MNLIPVQCKSYPRKPVRPQLRPVSAAPSIAWPAAPADVADPGAPKAKASARARATSSLGGKKKDMEKYSSSYTSLALVPVF